MILASPNVTITPELNFSNGHYEAAIAKLPTINSLVIVYRPFVADGGEFKNQDTWIIFNYYY